MVTAAKMAIAAGVDSIEHGSFLQEPLAGDEKEARLPGGNLFAGAWLMKLDGFPPAIATKAKAAAAQMQQMFQHASRSACPALGTDAGVERTA
jgi:histidine ammonia-lyase